jgi:acyl-CoA synthetase (AMP-forming)/AMP-acid ligase II
MPPDTAPAQAVGDIEPADVGDLPPFVATPDMIRATAASAPDRVAVKCDGRTITWGAFDRRLNRVARALAAGGLGKGDKIAVLATNSIEYLEVFMGALRAGVCVVPLSTMGAIDALEGMLDDSDSRMFFLSQQFLELVAPAESRLGKLVAGGRIAFDFERAGWTGYEAWVGAQSDAPVHVAIEPEDDFNIIYSSGTTGLPKGILHSHRMRSLMRDRLASFDFAPDTVALVSTPLYSNTTIAGMLPAIQHGGTVVLMKKFDVVRFLELAQAERATHAMLVPVQYQRLLAHPGFDSYDLSSFRMKLSTSAPLRAHIKADCLKRWPGRLVEIYGLTEGGGSCTLEANLHPDKLHTVGQPGLGCVMKIIDEDGNELPRGEVGEIVGRAAMMMKGYYKQPGKTRELCWHDKDGLMYFRSGDMGRFDADGFLELLDRRKDMVISGGFNVYPADIEMLLLKHPDVVDVAVIGIPSDQWGESPLALVVRRGGPAADAAAILDWANRQLGKTQRLAGVEFRESLPRSTIGKIMKRELRAPYWEGRGSKI